MTLFQALVLGIVQGLTEYLPVSSSAHLVLVPWALGWEFDPGAAFAFDVLVQMGTLVAVIAYFWKDLVHMLRATLQALVHRQAIQDPYVRLAVLIVLGTIPAVIAGVALKDIVETAFGSPAGNLRLPAGNRSAASGGRADRQAPQAPRVGHMDGRRLDRPGAGTGVVPGSLAIGSNHLGRADARPRSARRGALLVLAFDPGHDRRRCACPRRPRRAAQRRGLRACRCWSDSLPPRSSATPRSAGCWVSSRGTRWPSSAPTARSSGCSV